MTSEHPNELQYYIAGSKPNGVFETLVEDRTGTLSDINSDLEKLVEAAPKRGFCHLELHIALPYERAAELIAVCHARVN